ncbi:hypothetical protein B0T21DRAFT_398711 [Apiosordaria backusii]|uniref:Inhibitor of growth protein N-terminal histone-binding domain-containing protein n=1 Tax=Apiosordaria backusii TaxID=314023 RepID=A0AA40F046_9PEZI|nr:hypothetical protein B0T21DRAFT_398711 [Apiosordaria backusii]
MAAPEAIQPDADEAISPRQDAPPSIEQAMQESIKSIENIAPLNPLDLRADPDAQATVSDFLDFTEYLPADMMRSLTLIGQLDQAYIDASNNIDDLTTQWGQLPGLPTGAKNKNTPVELRSQVSENLHHALNSRVYSHAEAQRMAENVSRHLNRAKTIFAKLQAMQDNYQELEEQQKSPVATKSPQMSRVPKITLKMDGQKVRRPRVPRITVPGEVLAPYDINYDAYTTGTESSSEEDDDEAISSSRVTPAPRIKVVKGSSRPPKSSVARAPRPRTSVPPPNVPGGLSTSAAMAQLAPPPENAVLGSADAPWCQLTAFELARLRKRMKKNAAWTPSDTMVARELAALGRGVDAFKAAKKKAEDEGRVFEGTMPVPTVDPHTGEKRMPLGALTVDALASDDKNITNRGMKLNEAKKLKREQLAKLAADEAEQSERRFLEQARLIMGGVPQPAAVAETKAIKSKAPKKRKRDSMPGTEAEGAEDPETAADGSQQRPQFKRTKTETPVPPPILASGNSLGPPQETPVQLPQRTNAVLHSTTPIPLPNLAQDQSITAKSASVISATSPASSIAGPSSVPSLAPIKLPTTETPIPPPVLSPKKSVTPILPPVRETRQKQATRSQEQQQQSQPQQLPAPAVSAAAGKIPSRTASPELVTPKPDPDAASAPAPSTSTVVTRRPASRGTATSQEPALPHHPPQTSSLAADRPRRASTARNTPAPPEVAAALSSNIATTNTAPSTNNTTATASTAAGNATRPASKRAGKRPAPGVISRTNSGGNSAVGTRKAAPRKKQSAAAGSRTGNKKEKEVATPVESSAHGAEVEVDDEGNVIDPDEPRYCLCNRVSFGTMIQCDNIDVMCGTVGYTGEDDEVVLSGL